MAGESRPPGRRGGWRGTLGLVGAYAKLNLAMALEYRVSFVSQLVGMFINDGIWLVFWALYFDRFPVVKGWQQGDIFMLWAVLTFGYGVMMGLFGNASRLSYLILQGQLDYYLVLPKDALVHSLLGRMYFTAWGDALFGLTVFAVFGHPTPLRVAVYLAVSLLGGLALISTVIIANSLTFFLGSTQVLSGQLYNTLIHFATYPMDIFQGVVKVLLYTAIPVYFVSALPVAVLRQPTWPALGLLAASSTTLAAIAYTMFHRGLRRYESGNLVNLQG